VAMICIRHGGGNETIFISKEMVKTYKTISVFVTNSHGEISDTYCWYLTKTGKVVRH
jgi:hypothetical protein